MPFFGKLAAVVLTLALLVACVPRRGTASPEDYVAAVQLSLDGGRVAAMIARNEAIADKNFASCVASDVLASALSSSGKALRGKRSDALEIPAFDLDLADCMAVRSDSAFTGRDDVTALVEGITGVALVAARHYGTKLKAVDCRRGVAVLAVADYVAGVVDPLVEEITEPDGSFSLGAVPIDLTSCVVP